MKFANKFLILVLLSVPALSFAMQEGTGQENTGKDKVVETGQKKVPNFNVQRKELGLTRAVFRFKSWELQNIETNLFSNITNKDSKYFGVGDLTLKTFKDIDDILASILLCRFQPTKDFEKFRTLFNLALRFKKAGDGLGDFANLIKNFDGISFKKESLNLDTGHIEKNMNEILNIKGKSFSKNSLSNRITDFDEIIGEAFDSNNPELYLFSECGCISREKRSKFENEVVNCKNLENFEEVIYLGFAPGDLYPDLKILTELICKKKKKVNTIYLVDIYYQGIDLDERSIVNYTPKGLLKVIRLLQFIKILSEFQVKEGGEPIKLQIYSDLASYIEFCSKDEQLKANLATVLDLKEGSICSYIKDEVNQSSGALFYGRGKLPKGGYGDIFMTKVELEDKIRKKGLQEGGVLFDL